MSKQKKLKDKRVSGPGTVLNAKNLPIGVNVVDALHFSQRRSLLPSGDRSGIKEEESVVGDVGSDSGHVGFGGLGRGALPRVDALDQDSTADDVRSTGRSVAAETNGQTQGLSFPQIVINNFFDDGNQTVHIRREYGATVEQQFSHDSSPSIGAPNGAGVGTFEPTGGVAGGVPGHAPGTPSADIQVNLLSGLDEATLEALLKKRLAGLVANLRTDLR